MALTSTQNGVAAGMAGAVAASIAVWVAPSYLIGAPAIADDAAARLAWVLPWELLPLSTLLFGIAEIARHRFFNAAAIDGSNPPDDRALARMHAYLGNTTEQMLLAFVTHMVLAVVLPLAMLQTLPVLAVWFLVCRVLFRLGYAGGAPARSFGFAGTFYPTVAGMAVAAWFAFGA